MLFSNDRYYVDVTDEALQEDQTTYGAGYAMINRETGITEMTHMVLPFLIHQANQNAAFLDHLLEEDAASELSRFVEAPEVPTSH